MLLTPFYNLKSIAMKKNTEMKDPGPSVSQGGGCCGGGLTDWGCC